MDKIHFEVSELNMDIINNIFGKNDDATIEEYLTSEAITNMATVVGLTSDIVSAASIRSKLTGTTDVVQTTDTTKQEPAGAKPVCSREIHGVSIKLYDIDDRIKLSFSMNDKLIDSVKIKKHTEDMHDFSIEDLGSGISDGNVYISIAVCEESDAEIPYSFEMWFMVTPSGEMENDNINHWDHNEYSSYEIFDVITGKFGDYREAQVHNYNASVAGRN